MQFERKLNEQQGLGLGLTIAKRLVELHGGAISIEGKKGEGATVIAKLPKAKVEAHLAPLNKTIACREAQTAPGEFGN